MMMFSCFHTGQVKTKIHSNDLVNLLMIYFSNNMSLEGLVNLLGIFLNSVDITDLKKGAINSETLDHKKLQRTAFNEGQKHRSTVGRTDPQPWLEVTVTSKWLCKLLGSNITQHYLLTSGRLAEVHFVD